MTAARLVDQCGSEYCLFTRSPASFSAHSGWIAATWRAHRREVSTSSPAMTNAGDLPFSPEPGKIANRAPRAPRYSRGPGRLPLPRAPGAGFSFSSSTPMWESRPESSAWWMPSASYAAPPLVELVETSIFISLHTCRSWDSKSCHSRMRR